MPLGRATQGSLDTNKAFQISDIRSNRTRFPSESIDRLFSLVPVQALRVPVSHTLARVRTAYLVFAVHNLPWATTGSYELGSCFPGWLVAIPQGGVVTLHRQTQTRPWLELGVIINYNPAPILRCWSARYSLVDFGYR
jgi:hypothetical protein